jgi:PIN domain nuclease of toxin-antitoxin system
MKLLLDTHIWLWSFREPEKLTSAVHQVLAEPENRRLLSPVSVWEVLTQLEKKRLRIHEDFGTWFARSTQDLKLEEASLTWEAVQQIPFILPYHKDPADRFLVATAIALDLTLVTADAKLFSVPGLKVFANV